MELRPDAAGTATVTTLVSGLTNPQGLAFAKLDRQWVLYVAESDQVDRYPWGPRGISGARTVIAAGTARPGPERRRRAPAQGRRRSPPTALSTSTSAARPTPSPTTGR